MKIAWLTDPHLEHRRDAAGKTADLLLAEIEKEKPDVFLVGGDICSIGCSKSAKSAAARLLTTHPQTLFVLGNHDIWAIGGYDDPETPPKGMASALRQLKQKLPKENTVELKPLEKTWLDKGTCIEIGDTLFVGSMGFPDFEASHFRLHKDLYDKNGGRFTNDANYMDVSKGFLAYTLPMQEAFQTRLDRALAKSQAKQVVVLTHYPILEGQRAPGGVDDVGAYFFNWTMGQMVKKAALEHPDRQFIALAGHAHEYCSGAWISELPNLGCYGFKTTYTSERLAFFEMADPDGTMTIKTINDMGGHWDIGGSWEP
jgi:3',5'-cyclic AMP phosphodiesterase CpdA